jgi:hypothetical protein
MLRVGLRNLNTVRYHVQVQEAMFCAEMSTVGRAKKVQSSSCSEDCGRCWP